MPACGKSRTVEASGRRIDTSADKTCCPDKTNAGISMYTATLHFESHLGVDDLRVKAETLEGLREIADAEVIRRKPEAHWSSDVRKDGKPV